MKYESVHLKQMLAAEYVLGTLVGAARRRFTRLLASDRWLRGEVRYWEARFGELVQVQPVPPREAVWAEIQRRQRLHARAVAPTPAAPEARPAGLNFWRLWAGLATAASLILAVMLWRAEPPAPPAGPAPERVEIKVPTPAYVAAVRLPDEDAQWTVSVLPELRQVRVIANAPAKLDARSDYQLWWVADEGVTSLGLLPRTGARQVALPPSLRVGANGKIAVSLEPAGGSPTATAPSGPVLVAAPLVPSI